MGWRGTPPGDEREREREAQPERGRETEGEREGEREKERKREREELESAPSLSLSSLSSLSLSLPSFSSWPEAPPLLPFSIYPPISHSTGSERGPAETRLVHPASLSLQPLLQTNLGVGPVLRKRRLLHRVRRACVCHRCPASLCPLLLCLPAVSSITTTTNTTLGTQVMTRTTFTFQTITGAPQRRQPAPLSPPAPSTRRTARGPSCQRARRGAAWASGRPAQRSCPPQSGSCPAAAHWPAASCCGGCACA